ncbi:hypothetical protein [uncultured Fenollaria sp.]|uniref:hypothetical protein n=1 Tax=uncultured Fenollaria sp. TaxID=1686315 RepID=UPI0025F93466|nr:hypothetical protein [uncultured Fenollaria sp.]
MKNIMYIDSSYVFLNSKKTSIVEQITYDDSDKSASLKYLFKKFRDNKYLNKDTLIIKLNEYDSDLDVFLGSLSKIDLLSLNLKEENIMKIITDEALYKYDTITSSYEKSNFDINLYNLDKDQMYNYILNQANNTDGKVLALLKAKELEEANNILYLKDLFEIASKKYKNKINISLIINIALDIIILALIILLLLRFTR